MTVLEGCNQEPSSPLHPCDLPSGVLGKRGEEAKWNNDKMPVRNTCPGGEQLDAAVCCHAGIGTDRFHSLLHCRVVCSGSARWRLLELWDVVAACKGQDETSQPCVWFACHYLSCQGCPAARGPLRNSPGDVLAVRGSCIALGQRLRHFFQRYKTQLLKTHTVTPNPY